MNVGMLRLFIASDNTTKLHSLLERFVRGKTPYNHEVTDLLMTSGNFGECLEYLSKLADPAAKLEICMQIDSALRRKLTASENVVLEDLTHLYSLNSNQQPSAFPNSLPSDSKSGTRHRIADRLHRKVTALTQALLKSSEKADQGVLKRVLSFLIRAEPKCDEKLLTGLSQRIDDFSLLIGHLLKHGRHRQAFDLFRSKVAHKSSFCREICMNSLADELKSRHTEKDLRREAVRLLMRCGRERESYVLAKELGCVDFFVELLDHSKLSRQESLEICKELEHAGKFARAGCVYRDLGLPLKALECFFKANRHADCLTLISQDSVRVSHMANINIECLELYEELVLGMATIEESDLSKITHDTALSKSKIKRAELGVAGQYSETQMGLMVALYCHLGNPSKACQFVEMSLFDLLESKKFKRAFDLLSSLQRRHFRPKKLEITFELKKLFRVLESYLLVKPFVILSNHTHATGLLERAARESMCLGRANHVTLLTSLVIEAFKVGLKGLAYHWALRLCKPENVDLINPKCKAKIQKVALRPVKLESLEPHLQSSLLEGVSLETLMSRVNVILGEIGTILKSKQNGPSSPDGKFSCFLT